MTVFRNVCDRLQRVVTGPKAESGDRASEPSATLACRVSWFVYTCVFGQSIDQEPSLKATSPSKSCPEYPARANLFCRICGIHYVRHRKPYARSLPLRTS